MASNRCNTCGETKKTCTFSLEFLVADVKSEKPAFTKDFTCLPCSHPINVHNNAASETTVQFPSLSPVRKELELIKQTINHNNLETKEDIQKLQARFHEKMRTGSYTPSTYIDRYKSLNVQKVELPWFPKSSEILLQKSSKKKSSRKKKEPVLQSFFALPPEPGASETGAVQPWWETAIASLPDDLSIELSDEHKNRTIGERKPGELKARRLLNAREEFGADEMGQLESFMQDLMEQFQPNYCDGKLIQFFRLQRSDTWKFQQTPVYYLDGEGGKYLMGLLKSSLTSLGMSPELTVSKSPISIKGVLGLGGSSVVFKGAYKEDNVVVKHFRPNAQARLVEEAKNLELVCNEDSLKGRTIELIAITDDQTALLVRPVGIQFTSLLLHNEKRFAASKHFTDLVDIIKITHEKLQLVHRDLTLSNFFLSENGTVFLNDWGCAVRIGNVTTFSGSLELAPGRVLEGIQIHGFDFKYTPQASDDLEMIVKCFFGRLNPVIQTLPMLSGDLKKDASTLLQFWDAQLAPNFWKDLITIATKIDYHGLKKQIEWLLA